MEQRINKVSAFSKIRKGFYKQIAEHDKKEKIIIISLILGTLLLASTLLFGAAIIETSGRDSYAYVYGDYEQRINNRLCFTDDVQLIDMNALADYCEFEKEEDNYTVTYRVNGTYAIFKNESKIAIINGINKELPTNAQIKNGYCLIPLESAIEILFGVEIDARKKLATVSKSNEIMYIFDMNPKIEYTTDVNKYLEYINSSDEYIRILLNKENPIDEAFEPQNLVIIPEEYTHSYKHGTKVYLDATTMQALTAMLNDMAANGVTDVLVQSAYRTHAYQDMLFNMYIEREMEAGLSREEATIKANKYSARPEVSEHRTGLCVDFTTDSIHGAVDDVFEETEAFAWLKENAWKYGFIMRYPKDKENVTGYIYESWHYRFVGVEIASVIHQTGLCYEEYLEIFSNK